MQDWLNRIGLTLQFVALFLVTPEIIGEERVRSIAQRFWVEPLVRTRRFVVGHPINASWRLLVAYFACFFIVIWINPPNFQYPSNNSPTLGNNSNTSSAEVNPLISFAPAFLTATIVTAAIIIIGYLLSYVLGKAVDKIAKSPQ